MQQRHGLIALLVGLVATAGLVGAFVGRQATLAEIQADPGSAHSLQQELVRVQADFNKQQGELEMLRTRSEVDRQALEMVRREIAGHKEREAELAAGLRFYRGLMAPENIVQGLSVRAPEIIATETPQQYRYRIVVQQEARRHDMVSGELSLEIVGTLDGQEVSYPLQALSDGGPAQSEKLKFRYFQTLEGKFTLPDELEPLAIAVSAVASKPRKAEVSQRFPWQLQERFTHVGE